MIRSGIQALSGAALAVSAVFAVGCGLDVEAEVASFEDVDAATDERRHLPSTNCPGGRAPEPELCNGHDDDCDDRVDEDFRKTAPQAVPLNTSDGDRYLGEQCSQGVCVGERRSGTVICDEDDPELASLICGNFAFVNAGNPDFGVERCDGLDNDCDGRTDEDFKAGFIGPDGLPDDSRLLRSPEAPETLVGLGDTCAIGECTSIPVSCHPREPTSLICRVINTADERCGDHLDNDCDGRVDEGFDVDGDGAQACPRCVRNAQGALPDDCPQPHDCNDMDPDRSPFAEEVCNSVDDDCDGRINEGFDEDGDGFVVCIGPCLDAVGAPVVGSECDADCDDADASNYPGNTEACDGADNDCDDQADEAADLFAPACYGGTEGTQGVGLCVSGVRVCTDGAHEADVCQGEVTPSDEVCDTLDNDCDGIVDEETDSLSPCTTAFVGVCREGRGLCVAGVQQCVALQDAGDELCNDLDDDCDGMTDERFWARDVDGNVQVGDNAQPIISTPQHCGACGAACELPGVQVHTCELGVCLPAECAAGFEDRDGLPANGCELSL